VSAGCDTRKSFSALTTDITDLSDIKGESGSVSIPYDYLVYAVGCENQTFGIKGVNDYACFLKELSDADKIRTRLLDCGYLFR